MVKLTYDTQADAVYLYLKNIPDGGVARTLCLSESEDPSEWINVDLAEAGHTLGIEFISMDVFRLYLTEHGDHGVASDL